MVNARSESNVFDVSHPKKQVSGELRKALAKSGRQKEKKHLRNEKSVPEIRKKKETTCTKILENQKVHHGL